MTDRYEKIRQALAMGPTPGPWRESDVNGAPYIAAMLPENEGRRWNDPIICNLYEDVTPWDSVTIGPWLEALPNAQANGSFITACDPDTIRTLLEERDKLRGALEKAREALDNAQGNINPERSFADELEAEVSSALETATAALDTEMKQEERK